MAHFNFVISQNGKWGHAGFYIDRHRMTSSKYAYRKVLFYKKALTVHMLLASSSACLLECQEPPDAVQRSHYERTYRSIK